MMMQTPSILRCSGVRGVTPEDEADMAAFPIDEEADLKAVGAKGPFGEKVQRLFDPFMDITGCWSV